LLDLVNLEAGKRAVCTAKTPDDYAMSGGECFDRREGEDLLYGSHPKQCSTVDDCEIKNGNNSACLCGLDGNSYCQPELGSSLFDFYWSDCEAHNNTLSRGELQVMVNMLLSYYVYTISPPKCMVNSIPEIKLIRELAVELDVNGTVVLMQLVTADDDSTTTPYENPENSTDHVDNTTSLYGDPQIDTGATIDTGTNQDEDSSWGVVLMGAFALLLA
jgi:hypothetical protein